MQIAVTSQNWITVTKHAGKTRRFLVFEGDAGGMAEAVGRIELEEAQTVHRTRGADSHPLDAMDAVIVGSCGRGFVSRMAAKGIKVAVSDLEKDPLVAVTAFLNGRLPEVGVVAPEWPGN